MVNGHGTHRTKAKHLRQEAIFRGLKGLEAGTGQTASFWEVYVLAGGVFETHWLSFDFTLVARTDF